MIFELIALLCTAIFAGAAAYITFVEHPARLGCGPVVALAQWRPSYSRATIMQASLAVLGALTALAAWLQGRGSVMLAAGLLLGSVVPFTLIVIAPTNKLLMNPARDANAPDTIVLLRRWGVLHAVRTIASLMALLVLVAHVFGYA